MENKIKHLMRLILSPKYFPPFITILILLICSISIASLVSDNTLLITKENVVSRIEPATNAERVALLELNSEYVILAEQNGWVKVRVNSRQVGWVPKWYLENDTLNSDQTLAANILVSTPVYLEPNDQSEVMVTLEAETYHIILNENNGWVQIELENGRYGFIKTRVVNLINQSDIPSTDPSDLSDHYDPVAIQRAKEAAEKIIVVRYSNEPFLDSPSIYGNPIYNVLYGQKFRYLDEVASTENPDVYFMHVEDSEGRQGYVESRISAFEADSIGHVTGKTAQSIQEAVIMIDPGHGGDDPGGESDDGTIQEKNIALNTSMRLKEKLEAAGATVVMTRTTDQTLDLISRSTMSNDQQVDAFISVHYDRGPYADWRGTTTYYFHENDYELANKINNALTTLPMMPNNGTLFGNYSVLRENTRQAVLLELGYMSSPEDLRYIATADYQNQVATLIANEIIDYFSND